jgi:hypothetical protein
VLVAVLLAVALVGLRAGIPRTSWDHGPWHAHGTGVGIGLEAVLAVLLLAVLRRGRQAPVPGQPAAGLRALLRVILIVGLAGVPVLLLLNSARLTPGQPHPISSPRARLDGRPPPPAAHGGGVNLALIFYALLALVLLAAVIACVLLLRRRTRAERVADVDDLGDEAAESEELLRQAVRSGQAALREIDDARLAIIACYAAMEQSLARAGAQRGAAETPDELLARAAAAGVVEGSEAGQLTALFYEARFSSHALPADRRHEARQALEVLAESLRDKIARRAAEAEAGTSGAGRAGAAGAGGSAR